MDKKQKTNVENDQQEITYTSLKSRQNIQWTGRNVQQTPYKIAETKK